MTIHQILLKYWGYSSFRPLQEEIINSVLDGKDTLALLPTGGGKSLCFQVPALARDGVCLVISPLIALMKDQVDNLKKRGIPAAAVYSGMHSGEIGIVLENARHGMYKFLYCSPERIATERMRESLGRMKINLVAVDEAHCISQWGYDFRPPYLDIAAIRPFVHGVPFLALTATATPKVVKDIRQRLEFKNDGFFQKSFERRNLTYVVIHEEDKMTRLLNIAAKVKGPGVVYVRNRKATREVAEFLQKKGISADFYHAGLDQRTRDKRQRAWIKEEKRVIVSTNAFGMGIDKPNVRFVVHLDLPDCVEAYFQEAGRAGRDEKEAWAVLLIENADILDARANLQTSYPGIDVIRKVYQALGNHFQIPEGTGKDRQFDFDLPGFCQQHDLQPALAYSSLKFLEKEGYIMLTDGFYNPSRLFIGADRESLYRFQVEHEPFDHFIKTILRSYSGVLSDYVRISEPELAQRAGLTIAKVRETLLHLQQMRILEYIPQTSLPQLIYSRERLESKALFISPENYRDRLMEAEKRLEAMIAYATTAHKCRSQSLLAYFGECNSKRCGKCDVCLERNKISLNEIEFDDILVRIKPMLKKGPCAMSELVKAAAPSHEDKVLRVIQWLADTDKIETGEDGLYRWSK